MKSNLHLETSRRQSPTSLPPLSTTSTPASNPMATLLRCRPGPAPLALLALLALALTLPARAAGPPYEPPPIPITLDATGVGEFVATLNGTFDPSGGPVYMAWFAWSGGADIFTSSGGVVSAQVGSLSPGTTYSFYLVAANDWWIGVPGRVKTFTTLPTSPDFNYTTNDGILTITRYFGPGGAVTIPDTIDGLPVTSIGGYRRIDGGWAGAFCDCASVTSVTIPNSVTNLGPSAFYDCTGLTNVTMGNGVTSIGDQTFFNCTSLTKVTIPNSVTSIGSGAFSQCSSLTTATMTNSVTDIGIGAFQYCTSLANVTIPNSVASIGVDAFEQCSSLTNVTIPGSVTNIGRGAFAGCASLSAIAVDPLNAFYGSTEGVLFDKSQTILIQYPEPRAGSYRIPNTVTNIGFGAFGNCASLTSVTIPNSVTSMGDWAFENCASLTNATIGNSVSNIAGGAFINCGLITITVPNSVTNVGSCAFYGCASLTSVTIGKGVTSIGDQAFQSCASLTGVYFQGNAPLLSMYGSDLFYPVNTATVYYLPGTTGWGPMFGGRPTALWRQPLPEAWTLSASNITPTAAILNGTVNPNGSLTAAWFQWGATTNYGNLTPATGMGSGTNALPLSAPLAGLTPSTTYHFRVAATNSPYAVYGSPYAAYGSNQSFTTESSPTEFNYTITDATVTITKYTGSGDAVTVPSTITGLPVTCIGDRAFYQCTNLTSVTIPECVTSIGDYAFYECASLTALHFVGNAPGLGGSFVFYGDTNATVYYFPGTTGWGSTFGDRPTALWFLPNPLILTSGPGFGLQSNAFGFIIAWATNTPVVVEACTNLANHSWSPLKTNVLTGGWSYFSDPQWANYPGRFYRLRQP